MQAVHRGCYEISFASLINHTIKRIDIPFRFCNPSCSTYVRCVSSNRWTTVYDAESIDFELQPQVDAEKMTRTYISATHLRFSCPWNLWFLLIYRIATSWMRLALAAYHTDAFILFPDRQLHYKTRPIIEPYALSHVKWTHNLHHLTSHEITEVNRQTMSERN